LRANAGLMLAAAAATVGVQVGAYAAGRAWLAPSAGVAMGLLAGLLWVILVAPILAAGGPTMLDGLFRAGAVLDASAVLLVVLVLAGRALSPLGAVKVYLIWCSIGLAESALALAARRAENRRLLAVGGILLVLAVAAGPFWSNGVLLAAPAAWRERIALGVVASNPVFATCRAMPAGGGFVWNECPLLYEATVLGRDVPMPRAPWYATAGFYAVGAGAMGAVGLTRRRR